MVPSKFSVFSMRCVRYRTNRIIIDLKVKMVSKEQTGDVGADNDKVFSHWESEQLTRKVGSKKSFCLLEDISKR